jgi:hypothetical protein
MMIRQKQRAAVSLLEVLISVGVIAVGLLGVLSMIPVASHEAELGAQKDAIAIAGRRAVREFSARGFNIAGNLLSPRLMTASGPVEDINGVLVGVSPVAANRKAFCFDPHGYALFEEANGFDATNFVVPPAIYAFPSLDQDGNLPAFADLSTPTRVFLPRLRVRAGSSPAPMPLSMIDEIFRFGDDLEFDLPKRSGDLPVQIQDLDSTNTTSKRFSKGRFSWFATVVPETSRSMYRLSVAIVKERNRFEESQLIPVTAFATFGGGGELQLPGPVEGLVAGNWIMVMDGPAGLVQNPGGAGRFQYKWYRIIHVDGANLSVAGEDWASTIAPPPQAYVVVVPRVVSVYEREFNLRHK